MTSISQKVDLRIILYNGTLIDGAGTPPTPGMSVSIEGDRIVEVGQLRRPPEDSPEIRVIDVTGMSILPGFFDMHVHSTSFVLDAPTPTGTQLKPQVIAWLNDPGHVILARGIRNMRTALLAGITSVRDCGGPGQVTIWLRDIIEMGLVPGPRMFVSGQPVTTTAGHLNFLGQVADTVPEILRAVRRQVSLGADFIKVCATGGLMTNGSNRSRAQYSAAELKALVEDAHRLNRTVAGHTVCAEGLRNVVEAGCDTIEHSYWYDGDEGRELPIDEGVARALVAKGLMVSPVIGAPLQAGFLTSHLANHIWDRGSFVHEGEGHFKALQEWYGATFQTPDNRQYFANLRRMRDLGAPFIVGSDAGAYTTRFEDLWLSIAVLIGGLGFSPMEAIQSATQIAARGLRVEDKLGTIAPGKLADIVVVQGNPVADGIHRLREVDIVIKGGKIVVERGARSRSANVR